jgi:hypothetical protein
VEGLIIIALRVRPLALSRVVRLHRSLLQRRLCGIARFLAVLVWLSLTLKFFALQDSLMRYGGAALEAKLTIGFLNISLGQVLVFIVTVWTSLLVSRFVRFFSRKTSTTIGGSREASPKRSRPWFTILSCWSDSSSPSRCSVSISRKLRSSPEHSPWVSDLACRRSSITLFAD